ncbi:MAG: hypothetical protein FJY77_00540 [Candidatus Altiarchaeales archaeon]|nr:hypothetical protein [Candidatus Altiarchaeales archaeon]
MAIKGLQPPEGERTSERASNTGVVHGRVEVLPATRCVALAEPSRELAHFRNIYERLSALKVFPMKITIGNSDTPQSSALFWHGEYKEPDFELCIWFSRQAPSDTYDQLCMSLTPGPSDKPPAVGEKRNTISVKYNFNTGEFEHCVVESWEFELEYASMLKGKAVRGIGSRTLSSGPIEKLAPDTQMLLSSAATKVFQILLPKMEEGAPDKLDSVQKFDRKAREQGMPTSGEMFQELLEKARQVFLKKA